MSGRLWRWGVCLCVAGTVGAQDGARTRTYDVVVPGSTRPNLRGPGVLEPPPRQPGFVIEEADENEAELERVQARLRRAFRGLREAGDLDYLVLDSHADVFRLEVVGKPAGHAEVRRVLPGLQVALDAATLRFELRVLRAAPGGEPVEVARLPVVVRDGGLGEATTGRRLPFQYLALDLTGTSPRVRSLPRELVEGLGVSVQASRLLGDTVQAVVAVTDLHRVGPPQSLSWAGVGEVRLPSLERTRVESTLRFRTGKPQRLLLSTTADGAAVWVELTLLSDPSGVGPWPRDVCLAGPLETESWEREFQAAVLHAVGPRQSQIGFGFADPEPDSPLLQFDQGRWAQEGAWALPETAAQLGELEELLELWVAAHPVHAFELAWGLTSGPPPLHASEDAPPLLGAERAWLPVLSGRSSVFEVGQETLALCGVQSTSQALADEAPKRIDAPEYGFVRSGSRVSLSLSTSGGVSLRWSLAAPAQRTVLQVGAFPLTQDRSWRWDATAEWTPERKGWSLLGEAARPDGKRLALYVRQAGS